MEYLVGARQTVILERIFDGDEEGAWKMWNNVAAWKRRNDNNKGNEREEKNILLKNL